MSMLAPDGEIDAELEEALRLSAQVQEILASATQYSERVSELSSSFAKNGQQLGTMYARLSAIV